MAGGGSMLTVPVMLFFGIPAPIANGTNRVAIIAQCATASITFYQKGFRDVRLALTLAAAAIPGAVLGALVGVNLDGKSFEVVLAIIMLGVMILMATGEKFGSSSNSAPANITRTRYISGHLLMVAVGFWGGFIQIGVGFLLMPVLHRVLGLDLVRVNALKVFIILCYSIAAIAVFAANLPLLWLVGIALAAGNSIGGWLGAHTSMRKGETLIRWVLYFVLAIFIIKLLFF